MQYACGIEVGIKCHIDFLLSNEFLYPDKFRVSAYQGKFRLHLVDDFA